ncbi:hypothetical protein [Methylobacter psychrophilus]|jgi:hypothetical protein|uniref:hypothetical protein n=1 Tax=Methylobacter psychrophilus TaxID=96941 RepID=UPI0021D4EB72|nr:hypothetical protein [Methylobacter psychrophilus]
MKKSLFLTAALLVSGSALAATDHYVLRDGNHVQHLKITTLKDDITVSADVNFEPNASEVDAKPCTGEVSGPATLVSENQLLMKQRSVVEATYCELKVNLTPTGAIVEQSKDCDNFAPGICRFSTDGKELIKVK